MADTVIRIPEELAGLAKAIQEMVKEVSGTMALTGGGKAIDYGRIEVQLAQRSGQIEGEAHAAILQALDIDVPAIIVGGDRYTRVNRCEGRYHTGVGSVPATRSLYRRSGTRGGTPEGRVVDPISLRAGVVGDGWLPQTARAMAHAVQQGTSREAEATAREMLRLPYSRASFERVAHLVGALAVAGHRDIEDVLIDSYEVPEEARSISVSLDRVSVPMEEPRSRPPGRPRKGAAKNPVAVMYRMAYCGTVTLHDKDGSALHTIRYGCMPEGDATGMRDRLARDAVTLLSKREDLELELLCDGAPEMWNLLEEGFKKEKERGREIHRLVDLHHLIEKLNAAAKVTEGDQAAQTLRRWKLGLLNRKDEALFIQAELIASGRDEGPGENHPVHDAITYLQTHAVDQERMNYARARRLGLPLGSGNVEATCKSLFEMRLKRCGARWKETTGEHIVQLRALALSDRWGPAVELILRPLRIPVRIAA